MAKNRTTTKAERDHRLETVSAMYLQQSTQSEIAMFLGVSQQQIAYDLKAIRKQWVESAVRDFDHLKAQELAKVDKLESEHWKGWKRSCEGDGVQMLGEPKFLVGVHKCIERRCRLLGFDEPTKKELSGNGGKPIYVESAEHLTREQLEAIIAEG